MNLKKTTHFENITIYTKYPMNQNDFKRQNVMVFILFLFFIKKI